MQRRGEFDLIARVFAPLTKGDPLAFGLGDDAALVRPPPGSDLVVSMDAMVRGVHFDRRTDPGDVGRKLLRVNLSDLAAKGAAPIAYVLTAGWPADVSDDWISRFATGLAADQDEFGLHVIGGDTVAAPGDLFFAVTVFGHVPTGAMVRRGGAQAGDEIYVSGTIGDACLGLMVAQGALDVGGEDAAYLRGRLDRPTPRLRLGQALRGVASASIDVSDGLLADLGHICEQSGTGADLAMAAVPFSAAADRALARLPRERKSLLTFGDDYELAVTAPAARAAEVMAIGRQVGVSLTRIGRMGGAPGVRVRDGEGREVPFEHRGYQHF